ncbi:protein FAM83D [Engraulis encrasicolus]|uniref:protein FAM83D n=1 Tax=Engraulis encrasicolus TaxID=184585 RepID=UPI002FD1336B
MALSQCLEDSPGWRLMPKGDRDVNLEELYNERHRLALEELLSGGVDSYVGFLKREKIPNFLSAEEVKRISGSAVIPKAFSLAGDDAPFEQSVSTSMDCSSVTYFPDVSDVEPPILELGWPAFTTGSFRGVTRAVAHFQPSYGECIYSCKEAARKMIKGAKELIAIVTDSLTDLDIFRDLQEACVRRRVPVYILLDQVSIPSFLQMCGSLGVRLEELRLMRVRSITGCTYYMRSGARITGKVHERFMLIDGHKVATGSYRFNWTDGRINSSNLIELTGQITERFDEEFRILYAQSLPLNAKDWPPGSVRNSGVYDHLLLKHLPSTPPCTQAPKAKLLAPEQVCLTSTPTRAQMIMATTPAGPGEGASRTQPTPGGRGPGEKSRRSSHTSNASTLGDDWMERDMLQEEPLCGGPVPVPVPVPPLPVQLPLLPVSVDVPPGPPLLLEPSTVAAGCCSAAPPHPISTPPSSSCHISTQTNSQSVVDKWVQTDLTSTPVISRRSSQATLTSVSSSVAARADWESTSESSESSADVNVKLGHRPPIRRGGGGQGPMHSHHHHQQQQQHHHHHATQHTQLRDSFRKLSKERQGHYASIRSKLDNMVAMLSHRRELVDLTNLALSPALRRRNPTQQSRRAAGAGVMMMETTFMGTWPRTRGLQ